jgi:hypothetical protein
MKTKEDVESLEKLIEQLQGLHVEITQLVKKSPNDALNLFKLRLVNKVLARANNILMGNTDRSIISRNLKKIHFQRTAMSR